METGQVHYVVSYSDLFLYFQLLTSPKFGVERDSGLQTDLERFPLISFATLAEDQLASVRALAARLKAREQCWEEVDQAVSNLYALSSWDRQLIRDTLESELPFGVTAQRSSVPTSALERAKFAETFNELVEPFAEEDGRSTCAAELPHAAGDGWRFIEIGSKQAPNPEAAAIVSTDLGRLATFAQSYWASQITVRLSGGAGVVGYLDQRRYWSRTQARLLALEWLQTDTLLA